MQNKIIFSKTNNIDKAKKLLDMGINIISDNINIKNKYKILYSNEIKDENNSYTKILKITNENDLKSYKDIGDCIFLIDCHNLYDSLYLHTKIPKNSKSIVKCDTLTPHIAYMVFSVGYSGIFCNSDEIFKNGGGKFIHKINISCKKAKKDRFYVRFFNTQKPFTQLRNVAIDRIFKDLNANSIALDLNDINLKTILYVLKNKDIIKIGIINDRNQFKIARNLQDNGILDVLELESNQNLEYANFAFYHRSDPIFNMKIVD